MKKAPPDFGYFAYYDEICHLEPSGASQKGGQGVLKIPEIWSNFGGFCHEKFSDFKNSFAPDLPMPYAIMIHNRIYFHHPNPETTAGSCLGAQNLHFQA